jgi:4-amino-4-deoxy-L-arabinose transferase-like glycosyltransferase
MSKWLIGGILTLAFLLRVPFLDLYPIGFTPDEASFGYDAYSILHTGKDQWGHTLPFVLESFGDYKSPLYTYIDIPFVSTLGLTKVAVRLPNALLGVGAVGIVYLLVIELMTNDQWPILNTGKKQNWTFSIGDLALLSAFLLAISPWHVQLSRGAFEANMITFFVPLGILLFLKGLQNSKYLLWSAFVFGLSLFTYHTAKVVTPLIVGFIIVLYWNRIKKLSAKLNFVAILIFSVCIILTGITFLNGAGKRAADISIANGALESQSLDRLAAIQGGLSPTLSKIMYNKYNVIASRFIQNYTSYFSYEFLFVSGPREGTYGMLPGFPVLYLFELPFLILWVVYSIKNYRKKHIWIIIFWLLITPIPAALTQGVGHSANRVASMMPVIQICSGIGIYYFLTFFNSKRSPHVVRTLAMTCLSLIVFVSFIGFLKKYVLFSPGVLAKPMLYNNLELATWLRDSESQKHIIISSSLSEPHIYIAFVNSWDPTIYQKEVQDWGRYREENRTFLDQLPTYSLGKYTFKHLSRQDLINSEPALLVGRPDEFPSSMAVVKKFVYPNGAPSIIVVSPDAQIYAYKN